MRLDKYVSTALGISRNDARQLIKKGEIKLELKTNIKNDNNINEINDIVYYNNKRLEYLKFVYLMLNKPQGYLSATYDKTEKTVLDLVPEYNGYHLSMVGRLDKDTEGLLLLTNDGKLLHKLTTPKKDIYKKYYVEVDGVFNNEDIKVFENGMELHDAADVTYVTKKAILEIIEKNKAYVSISEGKYHQVKKMCLKVGKEVTYLKRVAMGDLKLDETLELGKYRLLTYEEIEYLKNIK